MEEQNNEALWYVVHTYSGYEDKVARDLQKVVENRQLENMICEIKIPVEVIQETKTIKKRSKGVVTEEQQEVLVENKLYPGYVFVKMVMTDDTWYIVRNTRGSTGFVGPASKPVPLTAEEVERMGVEVKTKQSVDFEIGDTLQITAGAMEGFMGTVEEIDLDSYMVKLKVNMFGRETPAEVDIAQVELL